MAGLTFFFLTVCGLGYASAQRPFTNCSAAFLDRKMVVNEYTDSGKCILPITAFGELTVCTASISPTETYPTGKIPFKIAIRDANTKTMVMYSSRTFRRLDVRKVLARCKKGDHIVLLTLSNEYALPHNEILVN
jgi:hypothetical protein